MPETMNVKQPYANNTINLCLDTLEKGKQAIVFVSSKKSAEKTAEDVAFKIKDEDIELEKLSDEVLKGIPKPTKQCERLARCARKGIAFHHAGLTAKQREIVEDNFRSGAVRIICSTPTLAAGIDMPAFRTIVRDLKRFSSTGWGGMQYIPVLEYLQMAGRAGRPKYDEYGEAICVANSEGEKEEIIERYINGIPEEIYSKLAVEPVLRTYILSLIASGFVHTKKELIDFFSKTFWAHQFRDMAKLCSIIEKMIMLLTDYEFIISNKTGQDVKDDFVDASSLAVKNDQVNEEKINATLIGKRVAQLYIDPLTAHLLIERIRKTADVTVTSFSLLQAVSNTLEMRPLLRVKAKELDELTERLNSAESEVIDKEPEIYEAEHDDFIASVKTAFFLNDWIDEKEEEFLLEAYNIRPGETRAKIDRADWLLYSAGELAKLMGCHDLLKEISKIRFRLKYGVKEELLPLLKLRGIGRVRARKMYNFGVNDLGDVKKIDATSLAQLIGRSIAIDIKKQVGQDVDAAKIPKGRRKGQMSLEKFDRTHR